MTSSVRLITTFISLGALSVTGLFFAGCKPKTPLGATAEPFTAELTEIPGVQAVYTLRHPKLVLNDLDKLMTAVPETSMLRMFMGTLVPYGYPEFAELAADTNIGIALLEMDAAQATTATPDVVAFAKLQPSGKIRTALEQSGLTLETHGEWTWISRSAASFAKVTAPDVITAYISRPQTEELRVWGRLSPALMAKGKGLVDPWLKAKLAARSSGERQAVQGYVDVFWSYLAQIHSTGGSLDLNDTGLTLSGSAQFEPDSTTGTWLRYAPGVAPKIATSIPSDGLMAVVVRQNMPGQVKFINGMLDALIAVDYPKASAVLTTVKANYQRFSEQSDGGAAMTIGMNLANLAADPEVDMFGVYTGKFSQDDVTAYYRTSRVLAERFTNSFLSNLASADLNVPAAHYRSEIIENALTVEGVRFDALETTITSGLAGDVHTATTTQYYGVAKGNLIIASSENALRAKLPGVLAGKPVANAIPAALTGDQIAVVTVRGSAIVDRVVEAIKPDLTDVDIQAEIKALKDGYAAAAPASMLIGASQAKAYLTYTLPYSFIAQSMRLAQFAQTSQPSP